MPSHRIRLRLAALAAVWVALTHGAVAAPVKAQPPVQGPPNFVLGVGAPISIDAADSILRAQVQGQPPIAAAPARRLRQSQSLASTSSVSCGTGTTLPVEITTLAAGLKCDPDLIFEYVSNNIEYEPLFGSNKGPLGTLLDQRGDDADQAQLFGALLSAAGFTSGQVTYLYGYIRLTGAQASGWLGVKNDAVAINNLIANGGTPISTTVANGDGTLNYIDIAHVWVQVQIGGTNYVFDPSFKQHTVNAGLSGLGAILGYSQSQFLTDAGGTIDSVSIRSIDRAHARADLTAYATNLVNYIKANNPAWTVNDIVGGKTINPVTGSPLRRTSLPYISPSQPTGFPQTWGAAVPDAYRTCFSISMPGVTPTACTAPSSSTIALYTDQSYGRRITISSVASGANFVPTLLIDGAAPPNGVNTGPATAPGANWAVTVKITHPYADPALANANQTGTLNMAAAGNYLISAGWGQVGRGMVEKHRTLLAQARASGAAADSEAVLGESLAVISYTWLAENASAVRLRDGVAQATSQLHHGVGVTAQGLIQAQSGTVGPYIDTPLNYLSIQPQTHYTGSCVSPTVLGSFFGAWGTASAMEAAVLEQTQALTAGMQAVSTIRLVDSNASTGARTYFADGATSGGLSTYFSTIRPNLTSTYPSADLARIDYAISTNGLSTGSPTGNQAVIPINGANNAGYWTGAGYGITAQACPSGMPYTLSAFQWITGALNGGSTGTNVFTTGSVGTPLISSNSQTLTTPPSADALIPASALAAAHALGNPLLGNPVDGVSGGYVYQHTDLTTGGGGYALSFSRAYSSASYTSDIGLGNGWSHNFSLSASRTSDPYIGLGDRAPIAAAPVGSALAGAGESSAMAAAQAIAATYVSQDLLSGAQTAQNMTVAAISQRWLTDQLTNNAVMASQPTSSGEFTWLPHADGAATITYSPPPGSAGTLTGTVPDASGNPTVFAFVGKDQSQVAYTPIGSAGNGRIAGWTAPYGASLAFTYGYTYNSIGYLTAVTNAVGRSLNFVYSGAHLAYVTDDTGRGAAYGYASNGDMTAAADPLGAVTTFAYDRSGAYDTAGHLTQVFYPSRPGTPFVTNWYDALGRVSQQADANNNRTTFYVAGARTEAVNPVGARQVSYQTPRGLVTMQAAVLDNSFGNVFSDTPQQTGLNVVAYQYDGQDRIVLATAPEGGTTAYTYSPDLQQNVVAVTSTPKPGSGLSPLTSTYAYDALYNRPVRITDPLGLVATMQYDPATGNLLKSVADAGGAGHLNATSAFTYNGRGQVLTSRDPLGTVTLAAYDALGNLTAITGDFGRSNATARATYSPLGDVLTATDARGNTTTMTYDAGRRLTSLALPATGSAPAPLVTSFTYNPDGQLLTSRQSVAGSALRSSSLTYTPTGNVATATDPNGAVVRYAYDAADRPSSVTDALGNVAGVGYDALSRAVASYNLAVQANPLAQLAYTPDGLAASLTIARSNSVADVTAYGYDGFNRPQTVTYADASTEAYSYDADGNVLTRTTRKGDVIAYGYDTLNRLTTKTPPGSAPVVSYAYDIGGQVTGVGDTGAAVVSPAASATYAVATDYDALNRPVSIVWSPAATQTAPTATSVTFTHAYDANNRRVSQGASDNSWLLYPAAAASATSYTANNLNQYTAVGAVTPTYDGAGALTYDGTFTYLYDVESRLASVKLGGSTVAAYGYDAKGARRSKTVGAAKTVYVTDADDRGVLDYDGTTGALLHWYAYGAGSNDVLSAADVGAGTRETLIPDIQGSVIGQLASGGTLTKTGYRPYGENPNLTADGYRYTGQALDAETAGSAAQPSGLYYYRARTYSPTWGRFLQPDPIGTQGGSNLYQYAGGSPLNATDPSGLDGTVEEVVVTATRSQYYDDFDNGRYWAWNALNYEWNMFAGIAETLAANLTPPPPEQAETPVDSPAPTQPATPLEGLVVTIATKEQALAATSPSMLIRASLTSLQSSEQACPSGSHYAPSQMSFPSDGPCGGGEMCTAETPPNQSVSGFDNPQSRYYSPPINTGGLGYDRYGNKYVRYNCVAKGGRSCSFIAGYGSMGYGVVTKDLPSGPNMPTGDVNSFRLRGAPAPIRNAAKADNQCVPN